MTHADLVQRAAHWLRSTRGCCLVSTRQLLVADERPDCIGWMASTGFSVLLECKVSRSDFRRDADKPSRLHSSLGMGNERFYLTAGSLIEAHQVPLGWGLLECWQGKIVPRKAAVFFSSKNFLEEIKHVLACAVRGADEVLEAVSAATAISNERLTNEND
jgi:hypothetical protein